MTPFRNLERPIKFLVRYMVLLSFCFGPLLAQSSLSTIRGTVKDQTQAVVPGTEVILVDVNTNVRARAVITDENGNYECPELKSDI